MPEMNGQLKNLLDRSNPLYPSDYAFRDIYMVTSAADDEDVAPEKAENGLQGWKDCFEKARFAGRVFAGGVDVMLRAIRFTDFAVAEKKRSRKVIIRKRIFMIAGASMMMLCLMACSAGNDQTEKLRVTSEPESIAQADTPVTIERAETEKSEQTAAEGKKDETMKMNVQAGERIFTCTLEENESVRAFVELMEEAPVVIQMSDYSGFEKVGSLGTGLPSDDSRTTTQSGDIVLYNGNQIVIFYGSNSWSYTRLGKIDDLTGWKDALGSGDVTVTFSMN